MFIVKRVFPNEETQYVAKTTIEDGTELYCWTTDKNKAYKFKTRDEADLIKLPYEQIERI